MPKVWSRIFHLFRKRNYRETMWGVQEMNKILFEASECLIECIECEYNGYCNTSKLNSPSKQLFFEAMEKITDSGIKNKIMMYILELECRK